MRGGDSGKRKAKRERKEASWRGVMIVTTTVARTNEHLGTAFGIFQVSSRRERGGGGREGARDPLFSPFFLFGKRSAIVEGIALDRERREDLSSCAVIITKSCRGLIER